MNMNMNDDERLDRSDTVSTCEMTNDIHFTTANEQSLPSYINDSLTSQEKAGYIAEHTSDLAIYLSTAKHDITVTVTEHDRNDNKMQSRAVFLSKKKSRHYSNKALASRSASHNKSSIIDNLISENASVKKRQRRYMIWNSICFILMGLLIFIYAMNRANDLNFMQFTCESNNGWLIFSMFRVDNLSTYYYFYGTFGLLIAIFYVIFFHISLIICCDRFSMALYVLFFTNIITSMIEFYCYIRIRQFSGKKCDFGDLPQSISLFISAMAIFGIIWTFLPCIWTLIESCFKYICPYRICAYHCNKCSHSKYSPFLMKNMLCKSIGILSSIGFIASTVGAAYFLMENKKQVIWTSIGVSLLFFKLCDIWILLCCQNGCDIKAVLELFGLCTRDRNDFQTFEPTSTYSSHQAFRNI